MDELEEIRSRKEKRNAEMEQMCECETKENKIIPTTAEATDKNKANKVSVLIHQFNAAAAKSAEKPATTPTPASSASRTTSVWHPSIQTPVRNAISSPRKISLSSESSQSITSYQACANLVVETSITREWTKRSAPSVPSDDNLPQRSASFVHSDDDNLPQQSTPLVPSDDNLLPEQSAPSVSSDDNLPMINNALIAERVVGQCEYRPVTPTDQIIGSLWDDINSELEKYKEAKKSNQFFDPNLSPRSRYGGMGSESYHTISSYRSQLGSIKRGVTTDSGGAQTSSTVFPASSSESLLPEKRQRSISDQDSISGGSSSNKADGGTSMAAGKDQTDNSTAGTTTIVQDQETRLKQLHQLIIVQQDQICQASRALHFCQQNEHFRGGQEEIDARRALLISTERRKAIMLERDAIINCRVPQNNPTAEPKGTLSFSSISLRLNRDYINDYARHKDSTNIYHFIVIIKCMARVYHTSLISSVHGIKTGFIEFQHYIPISGISPDFVCELSVYSLKSSKNEGSGNERSLRSKKSTWRRIVISTPLNSYNNTISAYSTGNAHAHRPVGVVDSGFQRVGHTNLTRQLVGKQKFLLNDPVFPLDGSCLLSMECHPDQNATAKCEHRSFLSLYQIVSGLGSWNRLWCVLANEQMNFWRFPEHELTKEPVAHLELSWCVSQVTPVPPSTASFPNSMQLDVMMPPGREGEKTEGLRMLFAADTEEEQDHWMRTINQAIRDTSIWRVGNKRK